MATDLLGSGKDVVTEMLTALPEELRGSVSEALSKPEAQKAVEVLGQHAKRQSEFSRAMDEARDLEAKTKAWHAELAEWYQQSKDLVEEGKRARDLAARGGRGTPDPARVPEDEMPKDVLTREEFNKLLTERERGYVDVMAITSSLATRHLKEFGEPLDVHALLAHPKIQELGLEGAYRDKFATQYAEKQQTAEKERIDKIVNERLAEERRKHTSRPPYPISADDVSPLDVLEAQQTKRPEFGVDAAVDEYEALVAKRAGG